MLDLARSEPGIPILPDQMDTHPWLLNCANGTLDLKRGNLREHQQEDYLTKLCPFEFHPEAKAPTWEKFLMQILVRESLIRFVQKLMGYSLTGDVSEHILAIFWGVGANGKSTLINAILTVLGEDYAIKANRDLFMARKQDNHPAQLARLFGKRLVVALETHEGARLDEGLVKELTGGDPICARRMREDPWQFVPTHKAILVTNHKPEIRGTDEGIWRRQRLVPFTVSNPRRPARQGVAQEIGTRNGGNFDLVC
jgi:putative DNA primase/helicase